MSADKPYQQIRYEGSLIGSIHTIEGRVMVAFDSHGRREVFDRVPADTSISIDGRSMTVGEFRQIYKEAETFDNTQQMTDDYLRLSFKRWAEKHGNKPILFLEK